MNKNYMSKVAEMLGVELGEEFNLVDKDGKPSAYNPYHIEEGGFIDCTGDDDAGFLAALLTGDFEIVRKPWKPKDGDEYYYIDVFGHAIKISYVRNDNSDCMKLRMGNCFRTREEAELNKERWLEYIKQEPDFSWRINI